MEIPKLNRDELIGLVQRIMEATSSEEQLQQDIEVLVRNVTDPKITDYIYWPDIDMTAEQIVNKALMHKPIALRG